MWSSLGSLAWSTLLTFAGYVLQSHYGDLASWMRPLTTAFLIICAAIYLYRVWRFKG